MAYMELCGRRDNNKMFQVFRFFKITTVYPDDSFAHYCHYPTSFMRQFLEYFSIKRCALSKDN